MHAISIAGNFRPIRHLAARAENMFFLVGAEKIRAILVPERHMMQHRSRYGAAAGIHELRVVRKQPAVDRYFPDQIRRLRHFQVARVRRQIHRPHAECDGMRRRIHFRIQDNALRDRMVHALLHEPVVLVLRRQRFCRAFIQAGMGRLELLRCMHRLFLCRRKDGRQQESAANRNCFFLHWTLRAWVPAYNRELPLSYAQEAISGVARNATCFEVRTGELRRQNR